MRPPTPLADPLLAGAYEFTIAYAGWQQGHVERLAVGFGLLVLRPYSR